MARYERVDPGVAMSTHVNDLAHLIHRLLAEHEGGSVRGVTKPAQVTQDPGQGFPNRDGKWQVLAIGNGFRGFRITIEAIDEHEVYASEDLTLTVSRYDREKRVRDEAERAAELAARPTLDEWAKG